MSDADLYLDWVNNFISVKAFADHHGMSQKRALRVIIKGRNDHEARVAISKADGGAK